MQTAYFTICSRNYLAYALVLRNSLLAAEPGAAFFVYLADAPLEEGAPEGVEIIPVGELGLPDLEGMAFRYTVMEFNTAIKADCFLDLLTRRGFDAAVYLDPDIKVFRPLGEVAAALEAGASAVLTPHILGPLPEGASPGEIDILKSGAFNLGFAAFSAAPESVSFLRWWAARLHTDCYAAFERGLFVDQRFIDFAPGFLPNLHILRHQGYNVAYWNLARRRLTRTASGAVEANGQPLVFFHFSGVDPSDPDVFSRHTATAAGPEDGSIANALALDYRADLAAQGHAQWAGIAYAWSRFADGSPILPPMRRRPPEVGTPADWFKAPDLDWWNAPDPRIDQKNGRVITRLMMGFWELRPDLREALPIGTEAGRRGLHNWFHRHGVEEYGAGEYAVRPGLAGVLRGWR
ncbi:group 1 glycosyl transferase [Hyphomonas sp.]|uniref:group 1 glycosyl transferase n=1 Tax=Hyphomonas sp. TaxID=87 RepID=UPI00391CE0C5